MFLNFNEDVRKILIGAKREMKSLNHFYVGTEHIILSILKGKNLIAQLLNTYDVFYDNFKALVLESIGVGSNSSDIFVYTPLLKKIIENSIVISKDKGIKEVNLITFFTALLEEGDGIGIRLLLSQRVEIDKIYEELNSVRGVKRKKGKLQIEELGTNLNQKVVNLEIDPVIGRDEEVKRVIEILCRRTKNNPLLIGEAGVGKTAVVEELARQITEGNVPIKLQKKKIISISMASLVSGTKYRGEFEERVTKLFKEAEESDDIIIFIDEVHTLVGAGGAEGAIDASNILKPSLARGKLNIIGATTTEEYKKFIENDKALARRFQKVFIEEPNDDKVYEILVKLKPIYEKYHNVIVSTDVLKAIVKFSNKYLYNRKQPDKAIDILDEVCSKVSICENEEEITKKHYKKMLKETNDLKNVAIFKGNYNEAIKLREEESKLETYINEMELKQKSRYMKKVTLDMVATVIKAKSNIPVYDLVPMDSMINEMNTKLNSIVIGQKEVINDLCENTRKFLLGIRHEGKPLSFLFLGNTGVGKTILAKEYAKLLFGENNLIKIDMSEYKEEHSISKIIGSPPGYVGYQNKLSLLEEIKEKPYSLLLLDEIEKAHPSVLNLFLQILDDGKIKDSCGNTIRFDNVVIIMTSNILCNNKLIGFDKVENFNDYFNLKKYFNIEFVNRIDKVLQFNDLNIENLKKIIEYRIIYFRKILNLENNSNVLDLESILNESQFKIFGARKVDKIILQKADKILVNYNGGKISVK